MTSLAELQAQFQSFLLHGCRDVEALTVGSDRLPAGERLAVYAEAYKLRLLEVLADDFPGLKAMIGDQAFEDLGSNYIHACPSTHPSVRWFGRHLEWFLRTAPGYRERPVLAEMAAFEWTQGEVMDAADSSLARAADLEALPPTCWPAMRIEFQSALRRLDLEWNVPLLWQALREQQTPPAPEHTDAPVPWLFWRRDVEVHWRSLDEAERHAIDAARGGSVFGEICQHLFTRTGDDQVPLRAAGYLKRWMTDELIAGIEVLKSA